MKTVALRTFQREGARALGSVSPAETWLLAGKEKSFILIPVSADHRAEALDLAEGVMAVMALRQAQAGAVAAGLDRLTDRQIDAEIRKARKG